MLLLAYINGSASLCRAAVRRDACLGVRNNHGVSLFNHPTPTKQLLYSLLGMCLHHDCIYHRFIQINSNANRNGLTLVNCVRNAIVDLR